MGIVLTVLLTILKWIGLILLWILIAIAAIILLIVVLLTIPIRIRAKGAFDQKQNVLDLNADISYFLKLVHARVFLRDKKMAWQLKIAGKTIKSSGQSEKPPDQTDKSPDESSEAADNTEKAESTETAKSTNEAAADVTVEEKTEEFDTEAKSDEANAEEARAEEKTEANPDAAAEDKPKEKPDKKPKKSKTKPKAAKDSDEAVNEDGVPDWAVELMEPIGPTKIEEIEEKIGALLAKVDHYYDLYERAPGKRKVIRALFRMIGRILRQFWFRNSEIKAVYGLSDPGTMGTIQAVIGMLGCYVPDKGLRIEVDPDFDEENIHVDADLKLRIHIQAFIHSALCFVFNLNVLRLVIYVIRSLRQDKKSEDDKTDDKKAKDKKKKDKKKPEKSKDSGKDQNKQELEQCADHAVERSNS